MGLRNKLIQITKFFLKKRVGKINIFIHKSSLKLQDLYFVVFEIQHLDTQVLRSTGMDKNIYEAYLKGLIELGEIKIVRDNRSCERSGLAGGLSRSCTINRAKFELIERDAFLYHYRNLIPFKLVEQKICSKDVVLFELQSAANDVFVYMATSNFCVTGESECILMGLGCHRKKHIAIEKAKQELECMKLDHKLRPGWCQNLWREPYLANNLPDFHHAYSRDKRNINIFKLLCSGTNVSYYREKISGNWAIRKLDGPFRFIKYFQVKHPDLMELEFGFPEKSNRDENNKELYHPIW